jgi:hypothetical protein
MGSEAARFIELRSQLVAGYQLVLPNPPGLTTARQRSETSLLGKTVARLGVSLCPGKGTRQASTVGFAKQPVNRLTLISRATLMSRLTLMSQALKLAIGKQENVREHKFSVICLPLAFPFR